MGRLQDDGNCRGGGHAATGGFILMLRMYWPSETDPSILDGSWTIPAAKKA